MLSYNKLNIWNAEVKLPQTMETQEHMTGHEDGTVVSLLISCLVKFWWTYVWSARGRQLCGSEIYTCCWWGPTFSPKQDATQPLRHSAEGAFSDVWAQPSSSRVAVWCGWLCHCLTFTSFCELWTQLPPLSPQVSGISEGSASRLGCRVHIESYFVNMWKIYNFWFS